MYCYHNINEIIKRHSRKTKSFDKKISNWFKDFCDKSKILLYYDIANHRFSKGIQVFGNKCLRFLKHNSSPYIESNKVEKYILDIKKDFTDSEIKECQDLVKKDSREIRFLIKGCFLTNGVLNLIRTTVESELGRTSPIGLDSLYSLTVSCIGSCNEDCDYLKVMNKRILEGIESLQLN